MGLILLDLRYPTDCSVLLLYNLLRRLFSRTFAAQICDKLRKCVAITGTSAMKIAFGNG